MKLLEIKDIAEKLGIRISTAYVLVNSEDFPSFKIGKLWKAPEHEVDLWIQRQVDGKFNNR